MDLSIHNQLILGGCLEYFINVNSRICNIELELMKQAKTRASDAISISYQNPEAKYSFGRFPAISSLKYAFLTSWYKQLHT